MNSTPFNRRRFLGQSMVGGLGLMQIGLALGQGTPSPGTVTPGKRRLKDVNSTDLAGAIRLGCRTMGAVFNEADHDIPFFASWVTPEAGLAFSPDHSEAHVPGRHLNALLHAEAALGLKIPEEVIEKHTRAAVFAFSGAVPLPLNRQNPGDAKPTRFLPHNLREGLHALYALTRYRRSEQANALAQQCIQAVRRYWSPDSGWDREALAAQGCQLIEWPGPFITGIARALGPLVKYYEATGYAPALDLALTLKSKALRECFLPDGSYARERFGTHTHSTTCVLSSLAYLAELTGDARLFERVRAFCENGLQAISDEIGWSIENTAPQAAPDRGECNNTGDILETALCLGRRGYPEYYQFAERILRCHLLPSQLRDISFIRPGPPPPSGLSLAQRHLGAFGFPAPYGHAPLEGPAGLSFNMDIVGGAVDSLCFAVQRATDFTAAGHRVHLLFEVENEHLAVASPYGGQPLQVTLKQPGPLWVRLPPWLRREQLQVSANRQPVSGRVSNSYYAIAQPPVNVPLVFAFDLPTSEVALQHRTRTIHARLSGDRVVAMENFGADLTFFPPLE